MANRIRTNRNEFHLDDKEQYILDEKFKLSFSTNMSMTWITVSYGNTIRSLDGSAPA